MRSAKAVKRTKTTKCRHLRNRNNRRRKAQIKHKEQIHQWMLGTVEGKQVKAVQLSALVNAPFPTQKAPKVNEVKEKKVVEPKPTSSKVVEETFQVKSAKESKMEKGKKKVQEVKPSKKENKMVESKGKTPDLKPSKDLKVNESPKEDSKRVNGNVPQKEPIPEVKSEKSVQNGQQKSGKSKGKNKNKDKTAGEKTETEVIPVSEGKRKITEPLEIDISSHLKSSHEEKCSMDSGVSLNSGGRRSSDSNSANSETPPPQQVMVGEENIVTTKITTTTTRAVFETDLEEGENVVTKFAQNVTSFVNSIQKKFEEEQRLEAERLRQMRKVELLKPAPEPEEPVPKVKKPRVYKLLPRDIQFCTYLMEKFGQDYEGMAKDPQNIYQDDAKGIARKIRIFRESPHYEEYLAAKANGSQ